MTPEQRATFQAQLLNSLPDAIRYGKREALERNHGQLSLFGATTYPSLASVSREQIPSILQLAKDEYEQLGVYLTVNPVELFAWPEQIPIVSSRDLPTQPHRAQIIMAGVVAHVKPHVDRRGKKMGFVNLLDKHGTWEAIFFSGAWKTHQEDLIIDSGVLVEGNVDNKGGQAKLMAQKVSSILPK